MIDREDLTLATNELEDKFNQTIELVNDEMREIQCILLKKVEALEHERDENIEFMVGMQEQFISMMQKFNERMKAYIVNSKKEKEKEESTPQW